MDADRDFPGLGSVRFAFLCFFEVDPAGGLGCREVYEGVGEGEMSGVNAVTRECGFDNPRNPGNESVFFWSEAVWDRLQKLFFLKTPGAGGLFGGVGAGDGGRDFAHVLISAALWHTSGSVLVVDFPKWLIL
jgi:hypothetical protein